MCEPATAMAIATAGAKYMEYTNDVADYEATVVNNANNRSSAIRARDIQISQRQLQSEQQAGAIADKKFDNAIAALKNSATYKTAAGEDNILGRSIDQALGQRVAEGLRNDSKLSEQAKMEMAQAKMDGMEIQARLEGRLAQIVDPRPPSVEEAVIGMATAGFQGANAVPTGTTWGQVFS